MNNDLYNENEEVSRKPRRSSKTGKRLASLALSAVLFGSVAGGSAYYVNSALADANTTVQTSYTATAAAASSSTGSTSDVTAVAQQGLKSVVAVTSTSVQEVEQFFGMFGHGGMMPRTYESTSAGSGVIIHNDGSALYMVTNYHVIEDATAVSVTFADGETYEASICGYDDTQDIAVLKVAVSDLSSGTLSEIAVASIGSSDDLQIAEQVVAIGNALGYGQSVTTGIVSAVDRAISTDSSTQTYIQTDAAINPGNSGGALFNLNGELVGINTAKISTTDVEGMGYAIPISSVIETIASFIN